LACYIPRWYTRPKTVTHPGTNRARRALTSFTRRTPLTTTPRRQPTRMPTPLRPPVATRQCCLCRVGRCELSLETVWQSLDSYSKCPVVYGTLKTREWKTHSPFPRFQPPLVYTEITEFSVGRRTWLGSRLVSVLDSGAEGPGFKSQPRRCRVTVLGKLFTPAVPLFTSQSCEIDSSPHKSCEGNCGPGGK